MRQTLSRVRDVRDQLAQLCERVEIWAESNETGDIVPIQKALVAGYFQNTGRLDRSGDSYRTLKCVAVLSQQLDRSRALTSLTG